MSNNKPQKIVVIGASAAGLRAAARARRRLPDASIKVIDESQYISYGACGMPYVVSGEIGSVKSLRETPYGVVRDPEFFHDTKGINVEIETRVKRIDREARKVYCKSVKTEEETVCDYDKLVLATGASPIMLPCIPQGSERITNFKTLSDTLAVQQALQKGQISKVCIVGAGAIGCEMAEALGDMWGADVILIDAAPNILPNMLDVDMGRTVENYLRSEGVEVYTDCPLEEITESETGLTVKTAKGEFEVDYAIIGIGVRPNSKIAVDCGLKIGVSGGIVVDEHMLTSDPNIYAAGDCIEVKHLISQKACNLPLGSLANRQGRLVGSNIGGDNKVFRGVLGSGAVKIFEMNVSATGLTEVAACEAGFDVGAVWGTFTDKADYYPEAANLHLKLVFDKSSGKLLGLQGYSKGEVVKRIDVFAALLKKDGTLEDLLDMEFAYAPPYASALDPLFSIGCVALAAISEDLIPIPPDSSINGMVIVDVRQDKEVKAKPVKEDGVIPIQLGDLREKWAEIPKGKKILTVCPKGLRAAEAARILMAHGYTDVVYMGGGLQMKT